MTHLVRRGFRVVLSWSRHDPRAARPPAVGPNRHRRGTWMRRNRTARARDRSGKVACPSGRKPFIAYTPFGVGDGSLAAGGGVSATGGGDSVTGGDGDSVTGGDGNSPGGGVTVGGGSSVTSGGISCGGVSFGGGSSGGVSGNGVSWGSVSGDGSWGGGSCKDGSCVAGGGSSLPLADDGVSLGL